MGGGLSRRSSAFERPAAYVPCAVGRTGQLVVLGSSAPTLVRPRAVGRARADARAFHAGRDTARWRPLVFYWQAPKERPRSPRPLPTHPCCQDLTPPRMGNDWGAAQGFQPPRTCTTLSLRSSFRGQVEAENASWVRASAEVSHLCVGGDGCAPLLPSDEVLQDKKKASPSNTRCCWHLGKWCDPPRTTAEAATP